jgi:hypothetical protein
MKNEAQFSSKDRYRNCFLFFVFLFPYNLHPLQSLSPSSDESLSASAHALEKVGNLACTRLTNHPLGTGLAMGAQPRKLS